MGRRCVKFCVIYLILVTGIHIQKLCLGNRRMSVASIAAAVEAVGGHPVSSDHTPHTASNWSAWLSSQKEASSKDNAQESN